MRLQTTLIALALLVLSAGLPVSNSNAKAAGLPDAQGRELTDSHDVQKPADPFAVPGHVPQEILTSVPEWAQDAVWYQIFVERFRDGDPGNQPTMETIEGSWPHNKPESWAPTPWGHDWYRMEPWAVEIGKEFYRTVHMRRYGGDLQGVLDKLDYLADLGITAIYFNPLNDAPSLHKYDARNYRHIDVNFGPDPEGDLELMSREDPADPDTWVWTSADKLFLQVIEQARKRGIRVIMDYSWNHTGITFWAWQHILEHQEASPYADWYQIDRFNDPATDENEFSFPGWAGVPELPQFRRYDSVEEFEHGDLIPGDFHPDLKRHIFAVTRRWLAPDGDVSRGVDGFRLDVAELIPVDFWRDYRKYVRSINPEAFLVGELWWADWPQTLMDPTEWLQGDIFDAVMNYRWYRPTRQWLGGAEPELRAPTEYVHHLDSIARGLRPEVLRAQMNLTASHDTPRFSTSIYNQGLNKYRVNPRENPDYKLHRPDDRTWRDVRLILAQQFTWIGAPHIWMGDELGMWGADDPDCRKPLIWPDLEFEDETTHPFGADRPRDEVRADEQLLAYYRHLIRMRRDHPVFVRGGLDVLLADDERNLLAYGRSKGHDRAVAAFNNHEQDTASFLIPLPSTDGARVPPTIEWKEVLDLQPVSWELSEDGIAVTMPPKSAAIFLRSFRAESGQPVPHRTQPGERQPSGHTLPGAIAPSDAQTSADIHPNTQPSTDIHPNTQPSTDIPPRTQTGANIPEWAKNAVWYQIFPERFRNSDPSNDPVPERIRDPHSWELGAPDGWEISPWTGDWYQRADWEQRVGPDFYDFVFTRRYGGDLQGVIDKLDYLDSLGVTAIYLNPVFDAVSLHKYDASHFHHIDRHFGPDPEGDLAIMAQEDPADPSTWQWTSADKLFLELVEKAHARGIRVVLDGVWNHVGRDFWAFRDVREHGASSRYASWFKITEFGEQYPDGFDYQGWWGYRGLPEFAEDGENLHPEVKQHIIDVTRRWMAPDWDPERGIDGWRLDMVTELGKEFWREWHEEVYQLNPEALTIAEIWGDEARDYIADDLFGVVMNYRWAYATHAFFIQQATSVTEFVNRLAELRDDFPEPVNLAMQNLLDGHDTERLASMIVNSEYAYKGGMDGEEQAKIRDIYNTYDVRAPNDEERELQRLIALFQFTYPGAPMIYYGTEAGMWGADDPDDRKPMVWPDMEFDDEINHPYSRRRPRDSVAFDHGLFDWYAMLARLRGEREALRTGTFRLAVVSDEHDAFAFTRHAGSDIAIVVINRGDEPFTWDYAPGDIELPRRMFDQLTGESYRVRRGEMRIQVPPRSARIITPL